MGEERGAKVEAARAAAAVVSPLPGLGSFLHLFLPKRVNSGTPVRPGAVRSTVLSSSRVPALGYLRS